MIVLPFPPQYFPTLCFLPSLQHLHSKAAALPVRYLDRLARVVSLNEPGSLRLHFHFRFSPPIQTEAGLFVSTAPW